MLAAVSQVRATLQVSVEENTARGVSEKSCENNTSLLQHRKEASCAELPTQCAKENWVVVSYEPMPFISKHCGIWL